ncbi:hypothetical protein ACG33_08535 [Steroidobacter denitrificans]|uniref:FHA domain-containing protein n=1 Tax=Steroidobacter denitrificans TaxID=465721 RepID=A0A127F9Q3_STEDE|nr:AAA family ATPase [Steroidobacter denitrificans]AMN47143.1 hypothetical protein ACG33_08535 [Steroidobacter denitrificans]
MSETLGSPSSDHSGHDFGLVAEPFADTAEEAFFFPADQHLRALEFMGHTLWTRARLGVVTAEHGCGKSYLIRRLLKSLDERIIAAAVQHEHNGPREFLLDILRQFGFALDDDDKSDRRRLLERFITHHADNGRLCLLIIENPQAMHPSVLEELRFLAALEADGARAALKILLLGQPSLNLVLGSPRMAQLVDASVSRFALGLLSEDQTAAYVAHRLRAAGAADADALMPHTLMPQIHACSGGVPARINRISERSLAWAASRSQTQVTAAALDAAIEELGWQHRRRLSEAPAAGAIEAEVLPGRLLVSADWAAAAPMASVAKLLITMQGISSQEVVLGADRLLIGRGEDADIRIDSVFVSRYHALIVRDKGQDLLLDLGSTNGLLVNSRRILRRVLRHRDLIQVGPARVIYHNERAAVEADLDPGETVCFARPGFPLAAGEDCDTSLLAFGRLDSSG